MNFTWEAFVLIIAGVILLRISGRKSIAQMTSTQTVVMISIGTIIVQPIIENSLVKTLIGAAIFTLTLIFMEWLQIRFNLIEKMLTGKAKIVIENGHLRIENLKRMRLTADQLEMQLRLHGVTAIQDVKKATLEANGQLGLELTADAKPLTVRDLKQLIHPDFLRKDGQAQNSGNQNIFDEIGKKNKKETPKKLK
ncbi:DUF421 domain-containing protein [Bacillus cabrialesii]|uniref:DUF421 domain-containing protein n=1 Tax=Bacillus cabrialesii subsp. tritici TaxID=2944916 RepID=A0ABT9DGT7_9BACI|nr:DUF421 domain-containing protein [Bacillus cabrialesii]MDO8223885.1 DUF421 domain-containing protein [Bacillus cabrialesii subsp. tritici]